MVPPHPAMIPRPHRVLTSPRGFIYPAKVSSNSTITRQNISFAIAGVIFGGVLGFIGAHLAYGGRSGATGAAAPETMGGQRGAPVMAPDASAGAGPQQAAPGGPPGEQGGPSMDQMESVTRELAALKKAVEDDPRNVAALGRLGNLYMDAGMFDKSVDFYKRALEIEPHDPDLRTDMGTCLRQMGRFDEAVREFERSVADDPKHWKGWFNIGIVNLYDLGNYQKAEESFAKALELNPGSFDMDAVRKEIEKVRSEKSAGPASSTPS